MTPLRHSGLPCCRVLCHAPGATWPYEDDRLQEHLAIAEGKTQSITPDLIRCWHHENVHERSFWRSVASIMHLVLSGTPILSDTHVPATSTHKAFKPSEFLHYHRNYLRTSSVVRDLNTVLNACKGSVCMSLDQCFCTLPTAHFHVVIALRGLMMDIVMCCWFSVTGATSEDVAC